MTTSQPNIILLVLDACRVDRAREYAPHLRQLGTDGVWFENAVAPATWTQPSHASIFTGKYPHEHGITQPSQSTAPTDLIDRFRERGYSTHGVSGNGFVSPLWKFDKAFDTFRYTQTPEPFPKGLDTYTYLRSHTDKMSASEMATSVIRACLIHNYPLQSSLNLASVGINAFSRRYLPQLTRIPHQTFVPNPQHSYSPEKNTALLEKMIHREAPSDQPFFAFANYMDTHRPYQSPPDLQRKHLGHRISKSEFERLNDDVAAPWEFIRLVQNDAVDDSDLETLRHMYAASVESVDRHIQRLVDAVDEAGIRDETVIVVVGDHGENLGETDCMGRQRFGHEASISDALARVPFVISHPKLEGDIEELVSVKDVYDFLLLASDSEAPMKDISLTELASEQVVCEYPALGDSEFYDRYPDIDRSYLRQRVSMNSVAAYEDDWRIVVESDGTELAFHDGKQAEIETAPTTIVRTARDACEQLSTFSGVDMVTETKSRLKELGYL